MKLQHVPIGDIVWNPWRDKDLYPISDDQITGLRQSIKDHGFFSSLKGRRRNGKVELGCGHARFEAARKRLDTIPIFIDDIDDDAMLRLMTDENALQSGANPGAVMNEVAAVTRRLIEGLLGSSDNCPKIIANIFDGKRGIANAQGTLRKGNNVHRALGVDIIRAYLGQGDPGRAHRAERQVREAISALKQSSRYDDIVEEMVLKFPPPVDAKPSRSKAVIQPERKPRRRMLDERTASVFPNDHQFHAFREAVTTPAAQRVIPVDQQLKLAKSIMQAERGDGALKGATTKKQIGAPYIKTMVHAAVEEGMKKQREIDIEEQELYLSEQREARIDSELHSANASLRSLHSALAKLIELADEFPHNPKIGGFSARLDLLVNVIQQLSRKLKGK
jgi:hypothetical protein